MNESTWFQIASWSATLLTFGILVVQLRRNFAMLLKPSFITVAALHLQLQWSSTIQADLVFTYLPQPWDYLIIVQCLPPVAAIMSYGFGLSSAKELLRRIRPSADCGVLHMPSGSVAVLAISSFCIFAWYLVVVPPAQTGLYAVIFAPKTAALVREESMKGLSSSALKYGYAIFSSTFAPLLAVSSALLAQKAALRREAFKLIACASGLAALMIGVSISGARGPSALLLLAAFFAIYVSRATRVNFRRLALIGALTLVGPTVVSALSSGKDLSVSGLTEEYVNILDRAFGRGIQDGLWHAHYAQTHSPFGIGGVGNIASLIGYDSINVFNVIGRKYSTTTIKTVSANTSFPLAYYACFGLISFLPSVLLLIALDCLLAVYIRIGSNHLLPVIASTQIACIHLAHTMFTAVFVTFGVGLIPLVGFLLSNLSGKRVHQSAGLQPL